jgi:hypothetical protein
VITVPELAAEALGSFLTTHMNRRFGSTHANLIEARHSAARLALECIGNSDALYHNVEHTMLVTLVGYDIMKGRSLITSTSASDYAHLIVACLFHDIGFVRGIRNQAGLRHCSAHGLRKADATIAANNGATAHQLMAIFGWDTIRQPPTSITGIPPGSMPPGR